MSDPDEVPRPPINSGCWQCRVTPEDIDQGRVIVSPTGKAHLGGGAERTVCGKDATGDNWWWPL